MHITIWESRYVSVDPTQSPSMPSQNTIKWNRKPGARSHNLNGVPVSGARLAPKGTCWPANKTTIGVLRVKFMQSIGLSKVCCVCLYENWQTWQFCSIYQSWIAIGCYVMQLLGLPSYIQPSSNISLHCCPRYLPIHPLSIPCCPATVAFGATGCQLLTMWTMSRKWCSRSSPTWEDLGACHGLMPQTLWWQIWQGLPWFVVKLTGVKCRISHRMEKESDDSPEMSRTCTILTLTWSKTKLPSNYSLGFE